MTRSWSCLEATNNSSLSLRSSGSSLGMKSGLGASAANEGGESFLDLSNWSILAVRSEMVWDSSSMEGWRKSVMFAG